MATNNPMVPTPVCFGNDTDKAPYTALAMKKFLPDLKRSMQLGQLNVATRRVVFDNGVIVTVNVCFNREVVDVQIPKTVNTTDNKKTVTVFVEILGKRSLIEALYNPLPVSGVYIPKFVNELPESNVLISLENGGKTLFTKNRPYYDAYYEHKQYWCNGDNVYVEWSALDRYYTIPVKNYGSYNNKVEADAAALNSSYNRLSEKIRVISSGGEAIYEADHLVHHAWMASFGSDKKLCYFTVLSGAAGSAVAVFWRNGSTWSSAEMIGPDDLPYATCIIMSADGINGSGFVDAQAYLSGDETYSHNQRLLDICVSCERDSEGVITGLKCTITQNLFSIYGDGHNPTIAPLDVPVFTSSSEFNEWKSTPHYRESTSHILNVMGVDYVDGDKVYMYAVSRNYKKWFVYLQYIGTDAQTGNIVYTYSEILHSSITTSKIEFSDHIGDLYVAYAAGSTVGSIYSVEYQPTYSYCVTDIRSDNRIYGLSGRQEVRGDDGGFVGYRYVHKLFAEDDGVTINTADLAQQPYFSFISPVYKDGLYVDEMISFVFIPKSKMIENNFEFFSRPYDSLGGVFNYCNNDNVVFEDRSSLSDDEWRLGLDSTAFNKCNGIVFK